MKRLTGVVLSFSSVLQAGFTKTGLGNRIMGFWIGYFYLNFIWGSWCDFFFSFWGVSVATCMLFGLFMAWYGKSGSFWAGATGVLAYLASLLVSLDT